jgi:transcriptional regulator with XRE-family HTH domain
VSQFGEALRRARLTAGLSQNELGRRAKVNPGTINRLEAGEREPTGREQVEALAIGLDLAPAEITRLIVAAGFVPLAMERLDVTDPVLVLVTGILADETIPAGERQDFRLQIVLAARRWRPDAHLPL